MRALAFTVLLVGCGASQTAKKITAPDLVDGSADLARVRSEDDLATAANDLSTGSDLATSSVDFAASVDLATANDFATTGDDLACGYPIGTLCGFNSQCACSTKVCDTTGDSYVRCCVTAGHGCMSNADCCMRTGAGDGQCVGEVCQPG